MWRRTDSGPQWSKDSLLLLPAAQSPCPPSSPRFSLILLPQSETQNPTILRTQEFEKGIQTYRLLLFAIISLPWRSKRLWAFSYLESSNCHKAIFTALSHVGIFFGYGHSWNEKCQSHQRHVQDEWKKGKSVHDFIYTVKDTDPLLTLQGLGSCQWIKHPSLISCSSLCLMSFDNFTVHYHLHLWMMQRDLRKMKQIIHLYICKTWLKHLVMREISIRSV